MATDHIYDVIIIGAGIMGSCTGYSFARNGSRTLILEQFPLPHSRGSSHGQSRVIRAAYGDCLDYGRMMPDAYRLWEEIQQEGGQQLYVKTGCLVVADTREQMDRQLHCYQTCNIPHKYLSKNDLAEQYPMVHYPDCEGIYEYGGGILLSNKAVAVYQKLFVKHGGTLHDGEPVLDIIPGSIVTVKTNKQSYRTNNLVVTTGAWTATILRPLGVHLPIEPWRVNVFYWKKKSADAFNFKPVLLDYTSDRIFMIPEFEYPNLVKMSYPGSKLCKAELRAYGHPVDADSRDVHAGHETSLLSEVIKNRFTGLNTEPSIIETCMYSTTPDLRCIIDRHPRHHNIVFTAGFSGSGFKIAPVIGKIIMQLCHNERPDHNIEAFSMRRFTNVTVDKAAL